MLATALIVAAAAVAPGQAEQWLSDQGPREAATVGKRGTFTCILFDPDTVDGERLPPGGVPVPARLRARFPALKIRPHFLERLVVLAKSL